MIQRYKFDVYSSNMSKPKEGHMTYSILVNSYPNEVSYLNTHENCVGVICDIRREDDYIYYVVITDTFKYQECIYNIHPPV